MEDEEMSLKLKYHRGSEGGFEDLKDLLMPFTLLLDFTLRTVGVVREDRVAWELRFNSKPLLEII